MPRHDKLADDDYPCQTLQPGAELSGLTDHPVGQAPLPHAVDGKHLEAAVNEIVQDMRCGACAPTISQTVQILDLGEGKKAAVIVTITTAEDKFL